MAVSILPFLFLAAVGLYFWVRKTPGQSGRAPDLVPGVVLMQAAGGIRQYFVPFVLIATVLHLGHAVVVATISVESVWIFSLDQGAEGPYITWPREMIGVLVFASQGIAFLLQGAIAYGCFEALAGRRPGWRAILRHAPGGLFRVLPTASLAALFVFWPAILIALPSSFAPWMLLLLPFVFGLAYSVVAVAVPAAWHEHLGIRAAWTRSLELTTGVRARLGLMGVAVEILRGLLVMLIYELRSPASILGSEVHWAMAGIAISGVFVSLLHAVSAWIVYDRLSRTEPRVAGVFE